MLQEIEGKMVEVVDFDTMPELPITGLTASEELYRRAVYGFSYPHGPSAMLENENNRITYAQALTDAIKNGVITEPGKYGIELHQLTKSYTIHKIVE